MDTNQMYPRKENSPWRRRLLQSIPVTLSFIAAVSTTGSIMAASSVDEISISQQTSTVTGVVVDGNGEPLIGVNVLEKGTTNGAITDFDGKFSLNLSSSNAVLVFSYIGFTSQEISAAGKTDLKVTMKEDTETLDEVIVIGYGAVRKADVAGAVAVMDNKSFKDQPITQASDALQGRVSGVQVENSGVPGGSVKIRVRGSGSINKSNDPLYVVDGIVRESGLDGINPEDIQSMQILKDASSTAIYGARGSNGVVLVTTKTGRAGQTQVTLDASVGISNVYKKYDLMNAQEFSQYLVDTGKRTKEEMGDYYTGANKGIDWQDEIFRTGITQNYKLAVSGGNEKSQYYVSGNYMGQTGTVIETKNERFAAKANITSQVTPWLHLTADINASHSVRSGNSFTASKDNPLLVMVNYVPTMEMMDANGNYNADAIGAIARNPVGMLRENGGETMTDVFTGRIDLRFNLAKGLTFTTTNGVDYYDAKSYSFSSKKVNPNNGMGNNDTYRMMLQSSNNLTYMGKWNKHSLIATAVYEATTSETRFMGINGSSLLTESVGWWNVNMAQSISASNNYEKWALMSGLARVMYNYGDKYLLTGTFRADGSSRFTKDKWGFFPSVAAAWTISNEDFMKDVTAVQDLKLRASFGIVGNQAIDPYSTLGLMGQTLYNFGTNTNVTGYWEKDIPTPDVTWEKTKQFDIGIDFSVLNHRLIFGIDYFDKRTTDALLQKSMPGYKGGASFWVNDGEISNRGVDVSLTAHIIQNKNFTWSTNINGSYIKNKVEKLAGGENDYFFGDNSYASIAPEANIVKPGYALGSFYGYEWTGLDENGFDTYRDLTGEGVIDGADRKVIGKATPDFTFGWNNSLSYKNWDLNIFINGSFGADRLNMMRQMASLELSDARAITLKEAYFENFDHIGQGSEYATLKKNGNVNKEVSTKWLENASYVRLENISLSYNLPKKIAKFADLRFTISAQNLFTITGYKGLDPIGSSFSGVNTDINAGIDMGAYPTPRTFTFGVRANF